MNLYRKLRKVMREEGIPIVQKRFSRSAPLISYGDWSGRPNAYFDYDLREVIVDFAPGTPTIVRMAIIAHEFGHYLSVEMGDDEPEIQWYYDHTVEAETNATLWGYSVLWSLSDGDVPKGAVDVLNGAMKRLGQPHL